MKPNSDQEEYIKFAERFGQPFLRHMKFLITEANKHGPGSFERLNYVLAYEELAFWAAQYEKHVKVTSFSSAKWARMANERKTT
jgi:ABC-type oligopeptide transport system substrate-binding subunit